MKKIIDMIKLFTEPYPKIRGNCKMCGRCCKSLILTYKNKVVTSIEQYNKLLKWDYSTYERFVLDKEQNEGTPLRFSCKYQSDDNSCLVHQTRPDICRTYPHHSIFKLGAELEEGCGYRVIEKNSFEDILEKKLGKSL